jgi:pimeloyl-ACP methyl ester carboxylesterase
MCNDVIGVMKDLGIARAVLGGCSVGSGIAIELGLDHPELFEAIILVGGNSGASGRYQSRIEGYTTSLADYHPKHIRMLVERPFADSKLGGYLLNMFLERGPRLKGEAIANVFRAGNGTDNTDRLHTMKVPTLVINGEFDNSMAAGKRTASGVPGAVHKVLPGANHACCLEDPATFDALVIEFLKARGLMPPLTPAP